MSKPSRLGHPILLRLFRLFAFGNKIIVMAVCHGFIGLAAK